MTGELKFSPLLSVFDLADAETLFRSPTLRILGSSHRRTKLQVPSRTWHRSRFRSTTSRCSERGRGDHRVVVELHQNWSPFLVSFLRRASVSVPSTSLELTSFPFPLFLLRNLLCMIPLRSASGSLVYFIGGQVRSPRSQRMVDASRLLILDPPPFSSDQRHRLHLQYLSTLLPRRWRSLVLSR